MKTIKTLKKYANNLVIVFTKEEMINLHLKAGMKVDISDMIIFDILSKKSSERLTPLSSRSNNKRRIKK